MGWHMVLRRMTGPIPGPCSAACMLVLLAAALKTASGFCFSSAFGPAVLRHAHPMTTCAVNINEQRGRPLLSHPSLTAPRGSKDSRCNLGVSISLRPIPRVGASALSLSMLRRNDGDAPEARARAFQIDCSEDSRVLPRMKRPEELKELLRICRCVSISGREVCRAYVSHSVLCGRVSVDVVLHREKEEKMGGNSSGS